MENRTNQIMSLDNGNEYFVNRQILYKGNTYYVATLLKKEESPEGGREPADEIVIFEEKKTDDGVVVKPVKDNEISKIIIEHL